MHYRSGLNMIPLIEWYRANPDDTFLLEISMGAMAGQLTNIDKDGATSMMWHAEPYIMEHDPHSGDYGLGFFGHSLESGAYYVMDKTLGEVCYLCDLAAVTSLGAVVGGVVVTPTDSYRRRVFVEPLGLYIVAQAGTFATLAINIRGQTIGMTFDATEGTAGT